MKTLISRERILKSSILFFTITAFILSALVLTSCSDSETAAETAIEDATLIEKIESATKVEVAIANLPVATETAFKSDLADSFAESVEFASGLGYKVVLGTDDASKEEATSEVYFSLKGKQLADTDSKRQRRRHHKCFDFVFPIDFMMADGTSITLTSKDDWSLIRTWYEENADVTERPELVFPVDVTIEDGTIQTLIDADELSAVKDSCKKGKDKRKCFKLILPVSFTMEDATVIDVTERADFKLLREWRKANPDATVKPALNFPVDVEYKDGTTATLNDQTEFDAAKDAC